MIRSTVASVVCLALLTRVGVPGPVSAAPAGPKVRVLRVDGDPVEGAFVRAGGKELVIEGVEAPLRLAAVREIRFASDAKPRALAEGAIGLRVVLRGGDVVRGALEAATSEDLTVRAPDLASLRIPFDSILRVEAEPAGRGPCDEPARDSPARKGTDLVYSRSGDAFAGTLAEATLKGIALEGTGTRQSLAWADLVVLHLDGPEPKAVDGLVAEIETVGGSLLLGSDASGDAAGWKLTLRTGLEVAIPRASVVAVRWSGGDFVRVGSLPYESTYTPRHGDDGLDRTQLERWWGARTDRTLFGCPLRIAGTTYRHGIAVHANSVVKVQLGKAYRRFSTSFGIDDEALIDGAGSSSKGNVTARVLVDGKEVWTSSGGVKGGEPARSIGPIDVTGAETLLLEVGTGGDQDRLDRADWAEPVLVRAP